MDPRSPPAPHPPTRSAGGAQCSQCLLVGEGVAEGWRGSLLRAVRLRWGSQTELLREQNGPSLGQEEGRVQPAQRETRYHGKDKLRGSRESERSLFF